MKLLIENWREYIDEANGEVSRRRGDYPSVRKAKRLKAMGKPDESSWVPGADDLSSLGKGIVEDDTDACGSNPYRNANGEFSSAGCIPLDTLKMESVQAARSKASGHPAVAVKEVKRIRSAAETPKQDRSIIFDAKTTRFCGKTILTKME